MIRDRNYTLSLLRNDINNNNKLSDKEIISELEDVVASLQCRIECIYDDIEQILLEGEPTDIGRKVTIDRLKEYLNKDKE